MNCKKKIELKVIVTYALLILSGLYLSWMLLAAVQSQGVSDFGTYYNATSFALQDRAKSPYANHSPYPPYYYPPPSILLFLPLLLFSEFNSKVLFSTISILAVVATIAIIIKMIGANLESWQKALLFGAAVFFHPFWFTVVEGQINSILLFLITAAFYLYTQKRDYSSGVFLGLSAIFKITPMLLVFYFIIRRRYKILIAAAGIIVVFSLLSEVLLDRGINWFYWRYIVNDIARQGGESYRDQSLNAFLLKGGWMEPYWDNYLMHWLKSPFFSYRRIVSFVNYAVVGLISLVVFYKSRKDNTGERDVLIDYCLLLMIAVLGSGLAWFHQYTILLLPLLIAMAFIMKLPWSLERFFLTLTISIAYVLMAVNLEYQFNVADQLDGLQKGMMFYGAVVLWLVLAYFRYLRHENTLHS